VIDERLDDVGDLAGVAQTECLDNKPITPPRGRAD
jgi:hypothetical protein